MKCSITECVHNEYCIIVDIIKKVPKDAKSCSYFTNEKQQKKQDLKSKRGRKVNLSKYTKQALEREKKDEQGFIE
jgi:hypothetical protein